MADVIELHVRRDALGDIAAVSRPLVVGDGEALYRIDRFALTANNMTYAAHGVDMNYWGFYPAPEGFGIVPVWGFATLVKSRVDGLLPGQRF